MAENNFPVPDVAGPTQEEIRRAQELNEQELDEKYPNRPQNHSKTLPFHDLFLLLFNPLNENKKKPTGPIPARRKQGPHGQTTLTAHENRRLIIERFIDKWRTEVGNDFFPAMRLILPEKDRERGMYGLKEKAIGKLLVRIMKIDKNSEDATNLLNWKLPGQRTAGSSMAGDFAGRCFEVLSKRPLRSTVGDMTVDEVNEMLDRLSMAQKEENQLPLMEEFYRRMNPEEMTWLIRMILRQMKIGATEKTLLDIWHPDAETLFNISSNLRRVCWELYDPKIRLEGEETEISLMQCFQPQLAQFQMQDFERMAKKLQTRAQDKTFWIEEKLDGERMQLHMIEDDSTAGGKKFGFWSRKAKDYTYLYGNGFEDQQGALTRHLKAAFHRNVGNIILDGEMIDWDMDKDKINPFGQLKSAALSESGRSEERINRRPLFRVFDVVYLNDMALTNWILSDRRRALEEAVNPVHRRLEIHQYTEATSANEIEPMLRSVVEEASEGLVLKNPRSAYRLNDRNDDWLKVKPEYMNEYGEALDCVVVGGYYGSGRRGGIISSFLCGLRVDKPGMNPLKCYSFFKVGGGFTAADYQQVHHKTEGKWKEWDPHKPPFDIIELAGGVEKQTERPDVWIRPDESVVFSVKAATVSPSDSFRVRYTLRFPRFKSLRLDRSWDSALSVDEFFELQNRVEKEVKEKKVTMDDERRRKRMRTTTKKKELVIAGTENDNTSEFLQAANVDKPEVLRKLFADKEFHVMTECLHPTKKSKAEIENLIKAHGGKIFAAPYPKNDPKNPRICIADREVLGVRALQKLGLKSVLRPAWVLDCIAQAERDIDGFGRNEPILLPWEPSRHMLFITLEDEDRVAASIDRFGDGYARDIANVEEMRELLDAMPSKWDEDVDMEDDEEGIAQFMDELEARGHAINGGDLVGLMMKDCVVYFAQSESDSSHRQSTAANGTIPTDTGSVVAKDIVMFSGGQVCTSLDDTNITHIVVPSKDKDQSREVRDAIKHRPRIPRIVAVEWIEECWKSKTLVDEERFTPS